WSKWIAWSSCSLDIGVYTPICCDVQYGGLPIRGSGSAGMSSLDLASPQPAAAAAIIPDKAKYDPRTRALIEGPIAATLIRLAAPNMLVMLAPTSGAPGDTSL